MVEPEVSALTQNGLRWLLFVLYDVEQAMQPMLGQINHTPEQTSRLEVVPITRIAVDLVSRLELITGTPPEAALAPVVKF